ncbi:hypothetical protein V6N12_036132 [Hibiscus sabdariffa]|uniref:Uncharacterized protein n=1 Tax=Hibiscus sabdariffa TaxID=183260 RepID=A0ABR2EPR3_9ROSI
MEKGKVMNPSSSPSPQNTAIRSDLSSGFQRNPRIRSVIIAEEGKGERAAGDSWSGSSSSPYPYFFLFHAHVGTLGANEDLKCAMSLNVSSLVVETNCLDIIRGKSKPKPPPPPHGLHLLSTDFRASDIVENMGSEA